MKSIKTLRKTRANKRKIRTNKRNTKKKIYKGGKKVIYTTDNFADAIDYIKQYIIDTDTSYEICGSIKPDYYHTVMEHETPPLSTSRANCMYDDYNDSIIWHNHPKTSKFYPSLEDIAKVIKQKNRSLRMSFIFTHFGYWRLETIHHVEITHEMLDNIKYWLDWLYYKTEKGRVYNEDAVNEMIVNLNILLNNILHIEFNLYS